MFQNAEIILSKKEKFKDFFLGLLMSLTVAVILGFILISKLIDLIFEHGYIVFFAFLIIFFIPFLFFLKRRKFLAYGILTSGIISIIALFIVFAMVISALSGAFKFI